MSKIGVDPRTGRLTLDGQVLDRHDPRMWGRAGRYISDGPSGGGFTSESGEVNDSNSRFTPEQRERLAGRVQVPQAGVGGYAEVIDPSKVEYDEELGLLTTPDNIGKQDDKNATRWGNAMMAILAGGAGALALGAGAGAGALGAGGGEAAGVAGAGEGLAGLGGLGEAAGSAGTAGGLGGAAPGSLGSGSFGIAGGASGSSAIGGGYGLGSLGGAGTTAGGAAGLTGLSGITGGGAATAGGAAAGSGLLDAVGGPSNVIRGAMGLAALGGAAGGGNGNSSGAPTDASSIIEQMARANRVDHTTPLGSRKWTQGADGRWAVNDTMDPTEAANFQTVQGINTNVSNATRDRLAAFLAQPARQRYDRPLGS